MMFEANIPTRKYRNTFGPYSPIRKPHAWARINAARVNAIYAVIMFGDMEMVSLDQVSPADSNGPVLKPIRTVEGHRRSPLVGAKHRHT